MAVHLFFAFEYSFAAANVLGDWLHVRDNRPMAQMAPASAGWGAAELMAWLREHNTTGSAPWACQSSVRVQWGFAAFVDDELWEKLQVSRPGSWIRELGPRDDRVLDRSLLPKLKVDEAVAQAGAGAVGWGLELAYAMSAHMTEQVPALNLDVIAEEVRRGCEAVALGLISVVLVGENASAITIGPEVLTGAGEAVGRSIGIEHLLRSLHVGHAFATREVMAAVARHVCAEQRFAEGQRVTELLFAVVDHIAQEMTREFGHVRDAWLANAAAVRMELVQEILRGRCQDRSAEPLLAMRREYRMLSVAGSPTWTCRSASVNNGAAACPTRSGAFRDTLLPIWIRCCDPESPNGRDELPHRRPRTLRD